MTATALITDLLFGTCIQGPTLPFTQGWYEDLIRAYAATVSLDVRVNTYRALQDSWYKDHVDRAADAYYRIGPIVLCINGKYLPLEFVRDEEIHDRVVMIPVVYMESYSADISRMWLSQFSPEELDLLGLIYEPKGLTNPIVAVDSHRLKRFERYYKLVTKATAYTELSRIIELIDQYTPMSEEYWKSQGVNSNITPDSSILMEYLTGGGFDKFVAIEIEQANGAKGLGIFSGVSKDQLYWDFTRRSVGDHIGNNILLAGIKLARGNGMTKLNLGVGYYQWKWSWADHPAWVPSVRFTPDASSLKSFMEHAVLNSPPPSDDLANKERRTVNDTAKETNKES